MLQTIHCLRTRSEIKKLQKLNNDTVAICTSLHGARIFEHHECQTTATFTHEKLNSHTQAISFSPNAEFMAFTNGSFIFIFHMPSKTVMKTIRTDGEKIEHLEFDLDSKYIIASTASGRVLQYRYDGSSLLARLYSYNHENVKIKHKANCFAFNSNIMACGSNNGTLFTINLHSRANKTVITNDSISLNALCFLDSTHLASGDSKGNIYINSIKDKKLIKKIETGFTTVTQIFLLPNANYMMVIGNDKHASVYDTKTFKLLHAKYIELEDIIKNIIIIDDYTLLASLNNNSLETIKLPTPDKLKSFLISNELDKAFNLAQKDPLLKGTKEYKVLEIAYQKLYSQALDALVKQNNSKALELTKMFKYVDCKQKDIQELFKAFENYPRFKLLYSEKKYALAYAMSSKFPPLTKTFQYEKMEEAWNDTFTNAQRQIAHGRIENAVTLLNEYATVIKKRPIIKLILKHNDNFIEFLHAIENKDFRKIEAIARKNELFTLVPTYEKVQKEMQKSLLKVQKYMYKCNLNSALEELSHLQNIDSIAEEVSLLKNECRALKKLQDAYEVNNFIQCFETIDSNNVLNSTELGILLQKHWSKVISSCEVLALKGNIKEIKETLGELILLVSRRDKIGDLFRLAFHTKIKAFIAKKLYKKAEAIIYSYVDIFGLDREIISIMSRYEALSKMKLAITQNARVSRDKWIDSELIMGS